MSERLKRIEDVIQESARVKQSLSAEFKQKIAEVADEIVKVWRQGGRTVVLGNGGSAADAQHFSAELVGRFLMEHPPMDVLALTTNTSTLTSLLNDYGSEAVFVRQVRAHIRQGDVLVAISTSGNSPNILAAIREAKSLSATTIGLTGGSGGAMKDQCDILLNVPSDETPRIQEVHILVIHLICELVEAAVGKE